MLNLLYNKGRKILGPTLPKLSGSALFRLSYYIFVDIQVDPTLTTRSGFPLAIALARLQTVIPQQLRKCDSFKKEIKQYISDDNYYLLLFI